MDKDINDFLIDKETINNFLYTNLPEWLTIGECEKIAVTIYEDINISIQKLFKEKDV